MAANHCQRRSISRDPVSSGVYLSLTAALICGGGAKNNSIIADLASFVIEYPDSVYHGELVLDF